MGRNTLLLTAYASDSIFVTLEAHLGPMFKHTTSPSPSQRLLQLLGGLCVFAMLHLCHWYLNGLKFDSESPNTISEPISLYLLLVFEVLSMTHFCTLSVDPSYQTGRGGRFMFSLIVSQCMFVECKYLSTRKPLPDIEYRFLRLCSPYVTPYIQLY